VIFRLRDLIYRRRNREVIYSTASYWDHKAMVFEGQAVSMWPNNSLNALYERELHVVVSNFLGTVDGLDLLDLGCGIGRMSRWFAAKGARVTGVDFSEKSLEIAKRHSSNNNPIYRHESIFDLVDENAYDVVFFMAVLTFACRDEAQLLDALTRIRRSLRPDGRLLLIEPIHRGFLHRVLNMDLHEFIAVMRKARFEINAITPLHFWPMRLVLAYVSWPSWVTIPMYYLGQAFMKFPGFSKLGDYWAIFAYPTGDRAGS